MQIHLGNDIFRIKLMVDKIFLGGIKCSIRFNIYRAHAGRGIREAINRLQILILVKIRFGTNQPPIIVVEGETTLQGGCRFAFAIWTTAITRETVVLQATFRTRIVIWT